MNTIMAYLDNMFVGLPKTEELYRIKHDLLASMEEKYHELKLQGKSEHEAIGIVISEFGNIDEIVAELGLSSTTSSTQPEVPELHDYEVSEYLRLKKSSGKWIGLGVFLIMFGITFLLSVSSFFEQLNLLASDDGGGIIGLIGMFVFFALGIGIFIYQGMKLQRFDYLNKGYKLSYALKAFINNEKDAFARTYKASIIIGVSILVLSPIIIFATPFFNEAYSAYTVSLFLLIVASAIYIFIYYGTIEGAYSTLLAKESVEQTKDEKLNASINKLLWGLAVALYLFVSFVYDSWHISWIIFVVTSILSGTIDSIVTLIKGGK